MFKEHKPFYYICLFFHNKTSLSIVSDILKIYSKKSDAYTSLYSSSNITTVPINMGFHVSLKSKHMPKTALPPFSFAFFS